MSEPDVEVIPSNKKPRVEPTKPPANGELIVNVHIISINQPKTAFSKVKRSIVFAVPDAACYMSNFDQDDYSKNSSLASIHAASIHSLVIGYFGGKAKDIISRVDEGNEPRLLNNMKNTNNCGCNVCRYFVTLPINFATASHSTH